MLEVEDQRSESLDLVYTCSIVMGAVGAVGAVGSMGAVEHFGRLLLWVLAWAQQLCLLFVGG
jgi:hypothetical protein